MLNIFNKIYLKRIKLLFLISICLIATSTISVVNAANITISPTTSGGCGKLLKQLKMGILFT